MVNFMLCAFTTIFKGQGCQVFLQDPDPGDFFSTVLDARTPIPSTSRGKANPFSVAPRRRKEQAQPLLRISTQQLALFWRSYPPPPTNGIALTPAVAFSPSKQRTVKGIIELIRVTFNLSHSDPPVLETQRGKMILPTIMPQISDNQNQNHQSSKNQPLHSQVGWCKYYLALLKNFRFAKCFMLIYYSCTNENTQMVPFLQGTQSTL